MNSADKKPAPGLPRPGSRLRRYAAAVGSLALSGTLVIAGLVHSGGVEQTDAAWTDTENAQAAITANWMEGFTRVTNASWKTRNVRNSGIPSSVGMRGPHEEVRDFGLTYPQIDGYALASGVNDDRTSFGLGASPEIVPERPTGLLGIAIPDAWMGRYTTDLLNTDPARASQCMSFPSPSQIAGETTSCGVQTFPGTRMYSFHRNMGFTYAIEASDGGTKRARVNASGFQSTAKCNANGSSSASVEEERDSVLELARGTGVEYNNRFDRRADISQIIPDSDDLDLRFDGTTNRWARFNVEGLGSGDSSFVLAANVRKNTYTERYYALAEMDLVVQIYSAGGPSSSAGQFIDQVNLPLTRAECGFSDGTEPVPQMAGTFREDLNQLEWPSQVWVGPIPASSSSSSRLTIIENGPDGGGGMVEPAAALTILGLLDDELAANELPPITTVTSPTEHTTASSTTTSEPPNPDDEESQGEADEDDAADATSSSTTVTTTTRTTGTTTPPTTRTPTTTSAPPATVVPNEPADLSATARTAEAGIVEVDGEDLAVVVRGTTAPADAPTALAALDTWINDGTQPGSAWEAFTADDPEETGWRWAAINQETGTVVYIR